LIDQLLKELDRKKLPYRWISEDVEAKSSFHWAEDTVKISTAHSAKGMDAPKVIILSAESFDDNNREGTDDTKLLYVAMTRAREELVVFHTGDSGLVPELQRCMKLYKQNLGRLIKFEEDAKKHLV
jgi:superfamily I DNA/RNA helicase